MMKPINNYEPNNEEISILDNLINMFRDKLANEVKKILWQL